MPIPVSSPVLDGESLEGGKAMGLRIERGYEVRTAVVSAAWDGADEGGDEMATACTHLNQIQDVAPSAQGCEDCLRTGDTWVHLRMCLVCGHVGCCDSSKNKHATKHFHATTHPIVRSFERGEDWAWCYVDGTYLEPA